MSTTMTRDEAIQRDRNGGTFYVDDDLDSGGWGIFGSESGFCYELCADYDRAHELAAQMNLDYGGVP